MYFYPTALLSGLLLVLCAADLRDAKAIAHQTRRLADQSDTATQLADTSVQTFHRGSGRRQLFWESALSEA